MERKRPAEGSGERRFGGHRQTKNESVRRSEERVPPGRARRPESDSAKVDFATLTLDCMTLNLVSKNRCARDQATLIRSCFFGCLRSAVRFVEAPRACVTKVSIFTERINAKTLISRRFSGGLWFSTVSRSCFYDRNASRARPYRAPRA